MSVRPNSARPPVLNGSEGELVSARITVDERLLESLLEGLTELPFPVNPQIFHQPGPHPQAGVEFPFYLAERPEVQRVLDALALPPAALDIRGMLDLLQAGSS